MLVRAPVHKGENLLYTGVVVIWKVEIGLTIKRVVNTIGEKL